jgi:cell wall-associated NlpC family hydrolase
MHWAAKYVGLKHEVGGRGPTAWDCWGLLLLVYANEFGITLPDLPGIAAADTRAISHVFRIEAAADWTELTVPQDGYAVGMSQKRAIHHVGVYLKADGGKILHCWDSQCVIVDTLSDLRLKGFRTVKFFRHRLWLS